MNEVELKILGIIINEGAHSESNAISSKELATHCGISVNTIRKEIDFINDEIMDDGLIISSKASAGHYLEILDREKAERFLTNWKVSYRRNQYLNVQYSDMVWYLARHILSANDGLTIDALCNELNCSTSTMQRYLKKVKKILQRYDLQLTNQKTHGLVVIGNEWNIRQCLLYMHKVYKLTLSPEDHEEFNFQAMFNMVDGEGYYDKIRNRLMEFIQKRQDFYISVMNVPKIINYILLATFRKKYSENLHFSVKQIEQAKQSKEFDFVNAFCDMHEEKQHGEIDLNDRIGLTMLLSSYETRNFHLQEMESYALFREEALEIINYSKRRWGLDNFVIQEDYIDEWICFLYTLKNRIDYKVYDDTEYLGEVLGNGLQCSDMCLEFAASYEKHHGIVLNREDTLSPYWLFLEMARSNRMILNKANVLVIMRYGYQCAKVYANRIKYNYPNETEDVVAREYCDLREEDFLNYDLLVTDMDSARFEDLLQNMSIINIPFTRGNGKIPELDDYFYRRNQEQELNFMLTRAHFYRVAIKTKEEMLDYCANLYAEQGYDKMLILSHLRDNIEHMNLERKNGVVFLPVLLKDVSAHTTISIIVNTPGIVWENQFSQVFITYTRGHTRKRNYTLSRVLERIINAPVGLIEKLLYWKNVDPIEILYPKDE